MTKLPIDTFKLPIMLTALRLPSFQKHWQETAQQADKENWPAARFLAVLAEYEIAERETRRIQRHLNASKLLPGKTLATYQFEVMPNLPKAHIEALAAGDWIERGGNLIAIGNSGTGKTHILCAIGHALIEMGYRVLYSRTGDLVQKLQIARQDLMLENALAKLDKFDLIILDDITYAHKDLAETSVLFELIARRYEYKSIAIAANQPFSAWDKIFPDKAMTIAAIDHLVHHASILEMNAEPNFRFNIRAETTKIESFHSFLDWIAFGGTTIKSGDPVEQAKRMKYMDVIANAVMLQNVVDLTNVLGEMADEGFKITPQLVSSLSPYMREKILRFGKWSLDMEDLPEPLKPKPVPMVA